MFVPQDVVDPEEKICTVCTMEGSVIDRIKNNEIVSIRPLPLKKEDVKPVRWKIRVGEKTFQPLDRATTTPYALSFRRRTYNPLRLKYPMKRVDFMPGGRMRRKGLSLFHNN